MMRGSYGKGTPRISQHKKSDDINLFAQIGRIYQHVRLLRWRLHIPNKTRNAKTITSIAETITVSPILQTVTSNTKTITRNATANAMTASLTNCSWASGTYPLFLPGTSFPVQVRL